MSSPTAPISKLVVSRRLRWRRLAAGLAAVMTLITMTLVGLVVKDRPASAAVTSVGTRLLSWGSNSQGQLGDGNFAYQSTPRQVTIPGGRAVRQASAGSGGTALAIASDNTLWAWGNNYNGQIGDGTTTARTSPVQIVLPGGHIPAEVASGGLFSLALATDGSVFSWGDNGYGELGSGYPGGQRYTPGAVNFGAAFGTRVVTQIAAGNNFALALAGDGTVWGWGLNGNGQLANPSAGTYVGSPVQSASQSGPLTGITQVSAGYDHSLAVTGTGRVWSWGSNGSGQLGTGSTGGYAPYALQMPYLSTTTITQVSAGAQFSLAVGSTGAAWGWGYNGSGQLGVNSTSSTYPAPVPVGTSTAPLSGLEQVSAGQGFSLATGGVDPFWSWGANDTGQLGDGTTAQRIAAVPVSLGGVAPSQVSAGNSFALAVADDGTLWSWGRNYAGQLGYPTENYRSTAGVVELPAGHIATDAAAGNNFALAVDSQGSVWSWGYDKSGQLGIGSTENKSTPVAVTLPGGRSAAHVAAGDGVSLALATDGTVWSWGSSMGAGLLGNGSVAGQRGTPDQVLAAAGQPLQGIQQVAVGGFHVLALTDAGTVLAWGYNPWGQLGNGSTSPSYYPVPVDMAPLGGRTVSQVAAGEDFSVALATDGTVWAWGYNSSGQLGNGGTTNSPVPVQVMASAGNPLAGISQVAAGYSSNLAAATDGTVWAWGNNAFGQLGDGTTTSQPYARPFVLPGGRSALQVSAGLYSGLVVATDGTAWALGYNYSGQLGDGTSTNRVAPSQVITGSGRPLLGVTRIIGSVEGADSLALAAPVVSVDPATHDFGQAQLGTARTATVTVANAGSFEVATPTATVTGPDQADFTVTGTTCSAPLAPAGSSPAGSCTFTVQFLTNTRGLRTASLQIADDATANPQTVALSGTGIDVRVAAAPATLHFGDQHLSTSSTLDVTVNAAGGDPATISGADINPPDAGFSVTHPDFPLTLGGGEATTFEVTFTPLTRGLATAQLVITHDGVGGTTTVNLEGTGTAPDLALSPPGIDFVNQQVGTISNHQRVTVSNPGNLALSVAGVLVQGTNATDFATAGNTCLGPVPPGGSCHVDVAFSPKASGQRSAELIVIADSPNSPQTVALAGNGVNPVAEPNATSFAFGEEIVASASATRDITIRNAGVGPLTLGQPTLTGADPGQFVLDTGDCAGAVLADSSGGTPGSCTMTVRFDPTVTGPSSASVRVPSDAANSPLYVQLSGTGVQPVATLNPAHTEFGKVGVGATAARTVTVTNTGTGTLVVSGLAADGMFAVSGPTLPVSLSPGATTSLEVTFAPTEVGAQTAALTVTANVATGGQDGTVTAVLTGTGTAPAALVTPASLTFGTVNVGSTSPTMYVTVSNSGTASLDLSTPALGGSYPLDYVVSSNGCSGPVLPGRSCQVGVAFRPTAQGTYDASLVIDGNAAQLPVTIGLSGTGTTSGGGSNLADLSVTDVAKPAGPASGKDVTFTITVKNAGPDTATDVTVSDQLDSGGLTFVGVTPATCTTPAVGQAGTVACTLTSLGKGAQTRIVITARVIAPRGATVTNAATVSAATPDPNTSNNTATATIRIK